MPKRIIMEIMRGQELPMRPSDMVVSFGENTQNPAVGLRLESGAEDVLVLSYELPLPLSEHHRGPVVWKDPDDIAIELGNYLQELADNLRGSATISDYAEDVLRKVGELWEVPQEPQFSVVERGLLHCALLKYGEYLNDTAGNYEGTIKRVQAMINKVGG